jgi:hypothetical protein
VDINERRPEGRRPRLATDEARLAEKADKARTLTAAGYWPAPTPGHCGVCRKFIHQGQWIRKLPDSYRPGSARRHAHRACIAMLL